MSEVSARQGPDRRRALNAGANAAAAVICAAACLTPTGPVAWLAGVALVLWLPGDAVRRGLRQPGVAGFVLGVATSLTATILAGLGANAMPGGIRASHMAVLLAGIAIVVDAAVCTSTLRHRDSVGTSTPRTTIRASIATYGVAVASFTALTVLALAVATRSDSQQGTPAQTALAITTVDSSHVAVGVNSQEPGLHRYELIVSLNDHEIARRVLDLRLGQRTTVTVAADPASRVEAVLREAGQDAPIRQVWLNHAGDAS